MNCPHINRDTPMIYKNLKHFISDETGTAIVDYGLILAVFSSIFMVVYSQMGTSLNNAFKQISAVLT